MADSIQQRIKININAGWGHVKYGYQRRGRRQPMKASVYQRSSLPSLVADSTLGRLAKWLRLAGFDVILDSGVPEPDRLLDKTGGQIRRIILTRTNRVYKALPSNSAIFVRHDRVESQLRQVMQVLDIKPDDLMPMTVCSRCNRLLIQADKSDLRASVPEYIWHHHTNFRKCPQCLKIYWPGTHAENIKTVMAGWFARK